MDVDFLGLIMGLTFTFNHGWSILTFVWFVYGVLENLVFQSSDPGSQAGSSWGTNPKLSKMVPQMFPNINSNIES